MEQPGKYCKVLLELPVFARLRKKDENKRILPNAVGKYLSVFMKECLEDQN